MKLQEASFLVTGGSLGIGKATAQLLRNKGANVAIVGRNAARLNEAAAEMGAYAIPADVGKPTDIAPVYEAFLKKFGRLDGLINNAGIGKFPLLVDATLQEMEQVFAVNVYGAMLMAQHAAKLFQAQNHGNIINIASTASTRGMERGTIYVASKFALRGMTQCWQAELRRYNVRVMLVNPSEVPTAFGREDGVERPEQPSKLRSQEIAHSIVAALEMDDRGFIPELTVWATNPQ